MIGSTTTTTWLPIALLSTYTTNKSPIKDIDYTSFKFMSSIENYYPYAKKFIRLERKFTEKNITFK